MTKRIFVTRRIPDIGISMLKAKGYEIVQGAYKVPPTKAELIKVIQKAKKQGKPFDAILTLLTDKVDADFIQAAAPSVKIISNYAVGYNNISLQDADKAGITITNTPGAFSDCIAEHTVALIFALTTRLVEADQYVRKGKYKGWDPMLFVGTDLSKRTVGILGAGHIGERVAMHLGKGFDMKVMYYDVKRNETLEKEYGAIFCANPEEIYKEADVISLHVPLLPSTTHMINKKTLAMMKKTAIVVNTARGPVVEEKALVEALKKGVIAGAGLDVFEFEPKISKELCKMSNVVLTPHIASARESARNEMATLAAQNIIDVLEGKTPVGLVKVN
ncbi:MAG: D-glycerate dehydrogenase [Candidatus Taylorbacteria bacterium]|nr:D-glycerate dehydrogenase [Candidatus Taylorbacteria bacterium]